ncbi:hypothetical protein [Xanthomonas bundabergensis]|uniref:hypothetical protein n=1 Tax=Xanthomonas bundabergensis TaxID=3160842 RepID=UPI00351511C6
MTNLTRQPWANLVGPKGRTLLCITTLGHRRFIDDAMQIVGLPCGSRLLLRYRKRYIAPDLWEAAKAGNLDQWHVLVVIGADVSGTIRFEPLRVGSIYRLSIEGEILTLEVALGGFAADGNYVWPGVASIAKSLPTSLAGDMNRSGHYLQALRECPSNVIIEESVEAWERAADVFFELDTQGKVPFLYLMQSQSQVFARYRQSGELVVESGSKLAWDIHTRSAPIKSAIVNPLGEVLIEVSCQPMRMVTSRRIRVDSQRDVKRMQLTCDAVFRTVPGHLSVKVIVFKADSSNITCATERNPVSLSRYDIPVRAGWMLPTIASLAAAMAATVAMLDKAEWGAWGNVAAISGGVLVFLSLKLGFRSGGS